MFGGIGREEEEEEEPSYSNKEEEDNKEEYMEAQNMDCMTQIPVELLGVFHKMPNHLEYLLIKYDLDKTVNA